MKIVFKVNDFMKIENAQIDISNFTVFVGENNSGKTKLMELIYGVLDCLGKLLPDVSIRFQKGKMYLREQQIQLIVDYVNQYLSDKKMEIVQSIFNQDISVGSIALSVEDIDLYYEVCYITSENLNLFLNDNLLSEQQTQEVIREDKGANYVIFHAKKATDNQIIQRYRVRINPNYPVKFVKSFIAGEVINSIIGKANSFEDMLFLPASRMGLAMMYKEYFGFQKDNTEEIFIAEKRKSEYISKPVLDFLSFLLKYSYTVKQARRNKDLIDFMNEHLLDGKLNENSEITTYSPSEGNFEIPLFLSSSMINELDPIMKMLTDAHQYNFLFYDEVETSLHPLKQLEMVKLLNRMNNKGMRILMTTHSEAFATKLNNLLLISYSHKIGDKKLTLCKNRLELSEEDLLHSKNIHVYQFVNLPNGKSEVTELEFQKTPFIGYSFELFENSANALFEETKLALGIETC